MARLLRRDLLRMGAGVLSASWARPAAAALLPTRASRGYPERIIHFPRSTGWLQLADDFDDMVPAHGAVRLPAGVPASLVMLSANQDAVPWLHTLKPDDLQELLCWLGGGTVCFDDLSHLAGLRVLELTDAEVTGTIDLNRFPMLEDLILYRTGVTEDRIAGLRQQAPHVCIDWQQ